MKGYCRERGNIAVNSFGEDGIEDLNLLEIEEDELNNYTFSFLEIYSILFCLTDTR